MSNPPRDPNELDARTDALRQLVEHWKQTALQRDAEVSVSAVPTDREVAFTKKGTANGLYEAAVDLENVLRWQSPSDARVREAALRRNDDGLLPCPLCGGDARFAYAPEESPEAEVMCVGVCGLRLGGVFPDSPCADEDTPPWEEMLRARWNDRAALAPAAPPEETNHE